MPSAIHARPRLLALHRRATKGLDQHQEEVMCVDGGFIRDGDRVVQTMHVSCDMAVECRVANDQWAPDRRVSRQ